MELRSYAAILARRWLIILAVPALAIILIVYIDSRRDTQYTAEARVSVSRLSEGTTSIDYEFDDYYDLLASDFILDDTVEVVRGNVFARAVAERLAAQNVLVDPQTVDAAIDASREHRILTISSTSSEEGLSVIVANVAAIELQENFANYLGQDGEPLPMTIRPVDVPIDAQSDDLRVRITYVLAFIVAVGFGIVVALAIEYFDRSLDAESAEAVTGLSLLGTVTESSR
jgi:capsular polysaccharide biosynthesis protein